MGTKDDHNHQSSHIFSKNTIIAILYALIPLALIHFYIFPFFSIQITSPSELKTAVADSSLPPPFQGEEPKPTIMRNEKPEPTRPARCDYSDGEWVPTKTEPIYNGMSCGIIKGAQNCMVHGRPDTEFLYWKWQPKDKRCDVPAFDARLFLQLIKNKHLAFVGDSMARNQLESLICLLSSASHPELIYQDSEEKKFRRWFFREYNATVSVFWSPFLVKGIEKGKTKGVDYNTLYVDIANEKWASELEKIDIVLFSYGHWFLHKAMYYEGNRLLGCSNFHDINCTDFSYFDVFKKVIHTTLKEVTSRFHRSDKAVVVTTFTSGHFEGEWDKFGACPKTEPYKEGEIEMPYLENAFRSSEVEELEMAIKNVKEMNGRLKIEALDVTKLALMRPDGHPGPYMNPNPFKDGLKDRVPNDCVHWCMPGPIDTWNEILLQHIKRWKEE